MNIRVIIDFLYQVSFAIFRHPVADDLLIRAVFRQIIRITKAEGIITAKSVVKGSAQHPGFVVIVWAAPLLPNDPSKPVLYRGISLDCIIKQFAGISAVLFAQGMYNGILFSLGLPGIDLLRGVATQLI